jgi:hypothetical protein
MKRSIIYFLLFVLLYGCNNQSEIKKDIPLADTLVKESASSLSQQDSISAIGREVLTLIKAKNYQELVKYFANEGVLFSPYAYIDQTTSKKLTPDDFLSAIQQKKSFTWGSFDGTGDPIKLSVQAYIDKFVYNADYLNAEAVGYNEVIKQGNSINNLKDIYPNHYFIDYHFSGFDQKYNGMDWTSLRLVFEKQNGQYFIVAIIHDQWTS